MNRRVAEQQYKLQHLTDQQISQGEAEVILRQWGWGGGGVGGLRGRNNLIKPFVLQYCCIIRPWHLSVWCYFSMFKCTL